MRFVVKIGTNLLTREDHALNTEFIRDIAAQVATLHKDGHEPLIVTSGAVAAGRHSITLKKENKHIPYRQMLAAVGQTFLLETYRDAFDEHGIVIGQVLLTRGDFERHQNFLSTKNTLELMLKWRIVPVINENDVTTFDELKFGDNDNLSARLASLIGAERLLMLTDVKGLYEKDPKKNPSAPLIERVEKITPAIKKLAEAVSSKKSRGGMISKLNAAEYATESGVTVWIAEGRTPNIVPDVILDRAAHGTRFDRLFSLREARLRWMQSQCRSGARLVVDEGARTAVVERGKSLLPSGVVAVEGSFKRGEVVAMCDANGAKIGFGEVNYGSEELEKIKGRSTTEILDRLGYVVEEEVIHRDNMVT